MLYRAWLSLERCVFYNLVRLFRIRSESERVARGFALGLMVNFFPTFGFGVLLSGFVARLFGGNVVAGVVGGALLTFAWPVLFYLNLRVGGWFFRPPVVVDELEDVTERTVDALVWGKTFMAGMAINSIIAFLAAYVLLRLVYHEIRPAALVYLRHHARGHQRRFRRPRAR